MSLERFEAIKSKIFVLPEDNIDTDQIIPARFLTTTSRDDLADACFRDWRFGPRGESLDHALNHREPSQEQVLVAGDNFGCGSSREHAPWALLALGFRVVVSTGIADIFRSNALKNGLLPIDVSPAIHHRLLRAAGAEMAVDLEASSFTFEGETVPFKIEPFARRCLLQGQDSLDVLFEALPAIEAFEDARV